MSTSVQPATISAKNERLNPIDFRVGKVDNTGNKVVEIYTQEQKFVVYRHAHAIRVEWDISLTDVEQLRERHSKITVELAKIYAILPQNLQKTEHVNRVIARALRENSRGGTAVAKVLLKTARELAANWKTNTGRLAHAAGALTIAFVSAGLVVALSFVVSDHVSRAAVYYHLFKVALCGALGGILAVSLRFDRLEINPYQTRLHNFCNGMLRIIISAICALFAFFAVESGVAFSVLQGSDTHAKGIYLLTMLAGFSEFLVPNLMQTLSSTWAGPRDSSIKDDVNASETQSQNGKS